MKHKKSVGSPGIVPSPKMLAVGKNIPFFHLGIFMSGLQPLRSHKRVCSEVKARSNTWVLDGRVEPQGKESLTSSLSSLKKGHSKCSLFYLKKN